MVCPGAGVAVLVAIRVPVGLPFQIPLVAVDIFVRVPVYIIVQGPLLRLRFHCREHPNWRKNRSKEFCLCHSKGLDHRRCIRVSNDIEGLVALQSFRWASLALRKKPFCKSEALVRLSIPICAPQSTAKFDLRKFVTTVNRSMINR